MSHSTVKLPVPSYQQRLQRMANELAAQYLPAAVQRAEQQQAAAGAGAAEGSDGTSSSSREEVQLREIQRYLYEEQRFKVPGYGRSNLPDRGTVLAVPRRRHGWRRRAHDTRAALCNALLPALAAAAALVDHPGVWENAGHAYLNEVLVTKRGIPAALAIVLADLVRRLLLLVSSHREKALTTRAASRLICDWISLLRLAGACSTQNSIAFVRRPSRFPNSLSHARCAAGRH